MPPVPRPATTAGVSARLPAHAAPSWQRDQDISLLSALPAKATRQTPKGPAPRRAVYLKHMEAVHRLYKLGAIRIGTEKTLRGAPAPRALTVFLPGPPTGACEKITISFATLRRAHGQKSAGLLRELIAIARRQTRRNLAASR